MYYVDTKTDNYTITTSYATKRQAEQYGGVARSGEIHLLAGEDRHILDAPENNEANDYEDLGRVRTLFRSSNDGARAGRFLLYTQDFDEEDNSFWNYTGISFQEYKDANKFLKSKSLVTFADMAVVENPLVSQALDSRGTEFSTDDIPPGIYDA